MATAVQLVFTLFVCFLVVVILPEAGFAKKSSSLDEIKQVSDLKDFKKLLRTHNNVLVIYTKSEKSLKKDDLKMLKEVAKEIKGLATLVLINCGDDKKLCKKMKVSPTIVDLKHYHEGDFNKDYDRKHTVKSMVSFLRDPKGDIPWEEEASATDVIHIESQQVLNKILMKEKRPLLVMFYAPWCGFCKKIKPEYAEAATELKGQAVMAGMDVDKPENSGVRVAYNITGFPTLCYFERGEFVYRYGGENTKDGLISWMKNPEPPKEPEKEAEWADTESDVVHLTDGSYDDFMQSHASVLVMFYAPWCGHCKKMKPEYVDAAAQLKEEGSEGIIAAVDATKEKKLGDRFKVKGFPTCKYFKDGVEAWEFNERTADKIVEFMKDPQEPPPPPPPEPAWEDMESQVHHLTDENFRGFIKKKKHTLVMYYAPWCGHCKKAKPEFMQAAEQFKVDNKVEFAAIDCTKHQAVCSEHDVTGYPTFKYFNYGKNDEKYTGGREEADFISFMKDPQNPVASAPPPAPSPDTQWAEHPGAENVQHLNEANIESVLKSKTHALVMFYAPWCGHCTAMKPAYAEAAATLKEENIDGFLAAVDATQERALQQRYQIQGFPTLKYFKNGVYEFDYDQQRTKEDLLSFMKNPTKKVAPPAEPKWSDTPSNVNHLTSSTFATFLADHSDVLIMFYAPWCGHCKKAKPEYQDAAAELLKSPTSKYLAAVDCTEFTDICTKYEVKGYPMFSYFSQGKFVAKFDGERNKAGFLKYLENPPTAKDEL